MFGIKSKKIIKELEEELISMVIAKNDLFRANEKLKKDVSVLNAGMIELQETNSQLKSEIETLKSKLTRKKPIKKQEQ
ncbi:MAG: hypothetical protein RR854_00095 [Muribaculaceae bacterium]